MSRARGHGLERHLSSEQPRPHLLYAAPTRQMRVERGDHAGPTAIGDDVHVLPSSLSLPGVGNIIVNAYVLLAERPVLVDTGLGVERDEFLEALRAVIDPADLAWVWLTHDDSDHLGSLHAVLELAPNAQLVTHGLGALRMFSGAGCPLDRVHAIRPGDVIDAGDRELPRCGPPCSTTPRRLASSTRRPTRGSRSTPSAAILSGTPASAADVAEPELVGGMTAWATFDSPWLHLTDASRLRRTLDDARALAPSMVCTSHLPPAPGAMLDQLLAVVASIPDAEPFTAPDAEGFRMLVAAMHAPAEG